MPFHKRTVEPEKLCRLTTGSVQSGAGQAHCSGFGLDLWTSLNDVSSRSLKNILQQLSDLSRHACSIFLEIQSEAACVIHRSAALQRRLETLQHTARKLDHKSIHICKSHMRLRSVHTESECWSGGMDRTKLLKLSLKKDF